MQIFIKKCGAITLFFWEAFSVQKLQIELLWDMKKCVLRETTSLVTISYVQTGRDACILEYSRFISIIKEKAKNQYTFWSFMSYTQNLHWHFSRYCTMYMYKRCNHAVVISPLLFVELFSFLKLVHGRQFLLKTCERMLCNVDNFSIFLLTYSLELCIL